MRSLNISYRKLNIEANWIRRKARYLKTPFRRPVHRYHIKHSCVSCIVILVSILRKLIIRGYMTSKKCRCIYLVGDQNRTFTTIVQ